MSYDTPEEKSYFPYILIALIIVISFAIFLSHKPTDTSTPAEIQRNNKTQNDNSVLRQDVIPGQDKG